ncbi:MAG: class I adenylate-forming enzyme family protein [Solirubrobacteraceae bacterium]
MTVPSHPSERAVPAGEHPSRRWSSIPEQLDAFALATPDAPAVAFPAGELTYAELRAATLDAARVLLAADVESGDRVGLLRREATVHDVAISIGAMRIGAIIVPINARNKVRELSHVVTHAGLSILLTAEEFARVIDDAKVRETCPVFLVGDETLEAAAGFVSDADIAERQATIGRDHIAQIIYTSGTTSDPKGCMHTHATLLAEGENCATRLEMQPGDRFWTPLPMFHCGGWQALLAAMSRGACFSHVGTFEGAKALDQLEQQRCTHAFPAFELIWSDILHQPRFDQADLSALRMVMNVGPPEHMLLMQNRLPTAKQVSSMGSTESAGSICIGGPHDSLDDRMRTSGAPLLGAELKVVDVETRDEVEVGGVGEMLFRGVTLFAGYYRDPEATAESMTEDGWFLSGDLVTREAHGGVAFVSRMKDMLKVGGENVAAGEIEGHIINHPDVAQVAVVGAPDARYGEVAVAYIQVEPGATVTDVDIVEFCTGQIASFKVPRYVRIVTEFPVTASQKVRKVALREQIAEELRAAGITEAPKLPRRA